MYASHDRDVKNQLSSSTISNPSSSVDTSAHLSAYFIHTGGLNNPVTGASSYQSPAIYSFLMNTSDHSNKYIHSVAANKADENSSNKQCSKDICNKNSGSNQFLDCETSKHAHTECNSEEDDNSNTYFNQYHPKYNKSKNTKNDNMNTKNYNVPSSSLVSETRPNLAQNPQEPVSNNMSSDTITISKSWSLAKNQDLDVKIFTCDTCGLTLSRADSLRRHQRVHSGERDYKCSVCGRCFALSSSLKQHVTTHSDLKMHECQYCSRKFARKDSLKRHYLVHSGIKEFRCEYCPKSFALSSGLKTHMLIHVDLKGNRCPDCGKMFARTDSLHRHIRAKTKCTKPSSSETPFSSCI